MQQKKLSQQVTGYRPGSIIDKGIILKHKSGKWIIGKNKKDRYAKEIFTTLDFRKKQYWRF